MQENIFGTDGIRGRVGSGLFDEAGLRSLADALGAWLLERYGSGSTILLAHDTRLSCSFVKSTLKSRLLVYPLQIIDAEVLPTPALSQLIQDDGRFACGIMISASHNPYHDNGIKIIDARTGKLTQEDEERISLLMHEKRTVNNYENLGTENFWADGQKRYMQAMIDYFPESFLAGKKIVLDCAHGAAFNIAPALFRYFGAEIITLNNQPNGRNINEQCGAVHTQELQKIVMQEKADCGFAFDGDADRVIAVNKHGQEKDGDDILALLLMHPLYQHEPMVVSTVMSNKGFEHFLNNRGKELVRTKVGDKYVSAALKEKRLLLGGEISGHIICGDFLTTGDGIFAALRCAEVMEMHNNWEITTFDHFPQVLVNVPVSKKLPLTHDPVQSLITQSEQTLQNGRILVRYSGTEPLLRIMVEDQEYDHAFNVCNSLAELLQKIL